MELFNKNKKELEDIVFGHSQVDKSVFLESEIIIYGAGSTGKLVLKLLKKYGISVNCFLDEVGGNGMFVDDIPVFKPDDPMAKKTARVIVALFNHKTEVMAVANFLRSLGFTDIVLYTEFFLIFSDELPVHYWLGPTNLYERDIKEITEALSLFQDEISCNLFKAFLKFRVTGTPSQMPQPDVANIYFPSDITEVGRPDKFIDCGAFDGDTLLAIRKKFGILDSIRAFEPDLNNFHKLASLETEDEQLSKDTVLIPCGVWSETIQLKFISDGSQSSGVSNIGDSTVQCVALDECLNNYKPTFIKMDIEGGELEALKGCQRMITSNKPNLAISIYHSPEHLWKIPLFIKKLNPDYKCYLRSHGYNGYDTVFYAYNINL